MNHKPNENCFQILLEAVFYDFSGKNFNSSSPGSDKKIDRKNRIPQPVLSAELLSEEEEEP